MMRQLGFTLIEILVALTLLALIGTIGWRSLDGLNRVSGRVSSEAGRWQEIAMAIERVGNDARQAMPVAGRDAAGRRLPAWQGTARVADGRPQLTLTRSANAGSDMQRIAYRWQDGRLELLTWPSHDAAAASRSHLLLEGIDALEFAYLDRNNRWLDEWPPSGDPRRLPRALRLRLKLLEGGRLERIFDVPTAD